MLCKDQKSRIAFGSTHFLSRSFRNCLLYLCYLKLKPSLALVRITKLRPIRDAFEIEFSALKFEAQREGVSPSVLFYVQEKSTCQLKPRQAGATMLSYVF